MPKGSWSAAVLCRFHCSTDRDYLLHGLELWGRNGSVEFFRGDVEIRIRNIEKSGSGGDVGSHRCPADEVGCGFHRARSVWAGRYAELKRGSKRAQGSQPNRRAEGFA